MVYEDTLIQVYGKEVVALEVATGKKLWRVQTEYPVRRGAVSQDGKRIFIQEVTSAMAGYGRWGSYETEALHCLDMTNGDTVWRSTILAEQPSMSHGKQVDTAANISQIIKINDVLYAYDQVSNIGGDYHGDLYAFDAATGE